MKTGNKIKSELLQAGVCAAFVVLVVWALSKAFAIVMISPDDVAFRRIMDGSCTGTPNGHTYFLQYPLSVTLAFLYKLIGGVHWYQVFLMGSMAVCMFLVFSRVCMIVPKKKGWYLALIIPTITCVFAEAVIHLEWTAVACVLGATAIFRYSTLPLNVHRGRRIWEYAVCVALLLL